jgi:hypothetical protein
VRVAFRFSPGASAYRVRGKNVSGIHRWNFQGYPTDYFLDEYRN